MDITCMLDISSYWHVFANKILFKGYERKNGKVVDNY